MFVDDGFVDERPQGFGGLHLRCVGGLEDEANSIWHGQSGLAVPAGIVEHEDDDPLPPGAGLFGEQAQ